MEGNIFLGFGFASKSCENSVGRFCLGFLGKLIVLGLFLAVQHSTFSINFKSCGRFCG